MTDAASSRALAALDRYRQSRPDVVTLAMLASVARRVEPELLRALRLATAHHFDEQSRPDAGTEGALWFSRLVETRGPDSITLIPAVTERLRSELQQLGLVRHCSKIVEDLHQRLAPVIKWEEKLVRLGLSGVRANERDTVESLAAEALLAVRSGTREGLEQLLGEMWFRLPEDVIAHPSIGTLRSAVDHNARGRTSTPPDGTLDIELHASLEAGALHVGELNDGADYTFRVPGGWPVVLELENAAGQDRTVVLRQGERITLPEWDYPVRVSATDGRSYWLEPLPAEPPPQTDAMRTLETKSAGIMAVAVSLDGREFLVGESNGSVSVWDASTFEMIGARGTDLTRRILALTATDDGFLSGLVGGKVTFEIGHGSAATQAHELDANAVATARTDDGITMAFSGSDDGTIAAWEVGDLGHLKYLHAGEAPVLSLDATGEILAAACGNDRALVIHVGTAELIATLPCPGARSVALSSDRHLVAIGTFNGDITLGHPNGAILASLEGHYGPVYSLAFTSDRRRLVSVSGDKSLRIWDVSDIRNPRSISVKLADVELVGLAITPDDRRAITGSSGNRAYVWDLDPELERPATPELQLSQVARVVLLGDRGAGKTALAMRLTGEEFGATEFPTRTAVGSDQRHFERESHGVTQRIVFTENSDAEAFAVLSDLQPADLLVIVIDATSTDEIYEKWLRESVRHDCDSLLVMSKADLHPERAVGTRGPFGRIGPEIVSVSAKTSEGIQELHDAIFSSIEWRELPQRNDDDTVRTLRDIVHELGKESIIVPLGTLLERAKERIGPIRNPDTPLAVLENEGTLQQLPGNQLVIVRPSAIWDCASALLEEARADPKQLASVTEKGASGRMKALSRSERATLRRAVSELLVERSICVLIANQWLAFPDLLIPQNAKTREAVVDVEFEFSGNASGVFVAVIVELGQHPNLDLNKTWSNAVTFRIGQGGFVGLTLIPRNDSRAALGLDFRRVRDPHREEVIALVRRHLGTYASSVEELGARKQTLEPTPPRREAPRAEPAALTLAFSYSRRDNHDGYVSALIRRIEKRCELITGAAMHSLLLDGLESRNSIDLAAEYIGGADVLVVLTSPSYFNSKWTKRELETFVQRRGLERVFKVELFPAMNQMEFPELENLMGYRFFTPGDRAPRQLELAQAESQQILQGLAWDIVQAAQARSELDATDADIYLVPATSDLEDQRQALYRELLSARHRVVLGTSSPLSWPRNPVRATLSVFLLGKADQEEAARLLEHPSFLPNEKGRGRRLIWRPAGEPASSAGGSLFERFVQREDPLVTVLESSFEHLRSAVLREFDRSQREGASTRPFNLYLHGREKDTDALREIAKALSERGYSVRLPAVEGGPAARRQAFEDALRECSGVIVYCADRGEESWLRATIEEATKVIASYDLILRRAALFGDEASQLTVPIPLSWAILTDLARDDIEKVFPLSSTHER
jgi:WD40 repeat protein/GTPase SAR1 family protein